MDFVKVDFVEIRKSQVDFGEWILWRLGESKWILQSGFCKN